ncbi:hypothetical protein JI721_02230 [Alicyclobacillus cycloheptanicus]|uniref:Uncharacterized protein n=1 Tax=Alicyclobacillus cycloheptanicus TaxID=1457 RepID=A0ABT9XFR2_9BACL|nr:hypothetical protein [Alicyclobacillus cycloheptanicus]MDQ0188960.1 hypothetical protein [Alicyclobacillus cycloheptanicus]WDM01691.1 hypothetical protein JI721_02230 [Alicyclobacillus cycloheptanicus]
MTADLHELQAFGSHDSEFQPEPGEQQANTLIFDHDAAPAAYELFDNCILKF